MTKDKVSETPVGLSLLIVDDEDDLLELLCNQFLSKGHFPQSSSHIAEALELLRTHDFDLVLCDLRMPGGGAEDLLKSRSTFKSSPQFIAMTGFAEIAKERALIEQGALVLEKPFTFESIRPLLEDLVRNRKKAS